MAVSPYATTNRNTAEQIRQVDTLLELMSPTEVPLLKLFGIKGEEGTNRKFEWEEGTLLAESDTLAAGGALLPSGYTDRALLDWHRRGDAPSALYRSGAALPRSDRSTSPAGRR